jgi:hypothetical protein
VSWTSVAFKSQDDRSSEPVIRRVNYEGPHAPAVGETEVLSRRAGPATNGTTRVSVAGAPELSVDCGYDPRDGAIKHGISGRLGDQRLRIVRPRFSLTPRSRAIFFELEDGQRWALVSSGFARCELRRGSPGGEAIFRSGTPMKPAVEEGIQPHEVAFVVTCSVLGSLYELTKILARVAKGI